jgi:RNA polymerase sigma-70 factor, ECF subfamily
VLTATPVSEEAEGLSARPVFEDVFRAHYARLVRALTVACGDAETAEDCVQDAFVRAHVRWAKVSRYDDPVGWIRHVALNRLRDHARKTGRGRRAVERFAGRREQHLSEDGPTDAGDIGALLVGLPQQQRTAISLFYVGDLSVAEIASAMGLSDGAVKFHLHQGRKRLEPLLGPNAGAMREGDR